MSIRQLAMRHVGRPVWVHSHYGMHYGVLHHVDDNGMYLQLMNRNRRASAKQGEGEAVRLDQLPEEVDAQQAWWPWFFIPWGAAWAMGPWGWWW